MKDALPKRAVRRVVVGFIISPFQAPKPAPQNVSRYSTKPEAFHRSSKRVLLPLARFARNYGVANRHLTHTTFEANGILRRHVAQGSFQMPYDGACRQPNPFALYAALINTHRYLGRPHPMAERNYLEKRTKTARVMPKMSQISPHICQSVPAILNLVKILNKH
jgi:hypothetical protein